MFTFVIVNIVTMKERLLEFLKNENKSSAQLAEEIGVQASGISHILSGRNNPSLDFVLKMLEKYRYLSTDWLLFGKGTMYKESKMQNLFDYDPSYNTIKPEIEEQNTLSAAHLDNNRAKETITDSETVDSQKKIASEVVKIVWFYEDSSFEEFFPRR